MRIFPKSLQVAVLILLTPAMALANPQGATVRAGQITFDPSGSDLRILQGSNKAIIDWNSFSIGEGEATRFLMPGSNSAVLNRVTGPDISSLQGLLQANGKVFLLNPHGVVVGANGIIDTGGFVASTLNVTDEDFLNGNDLLFKGASNAAIVNLGKISASDSDVVLIATQVDNRGQISAPDGTAALAAGTEVLLQEAGAERVFVRQGNASSVRNSGDIAAQVAELKAGGNIYGLAIQNSGKVRATGAVNEGGQIFLRANGGKIANAGKLEATRPGGGSKVDIQAGNNGDVELTAASQVKGNQVNVQSIGGSVKQAGGITAPAEGAQVGRVVVNSGAGGDTVVAGSINASNPAGKGGSITITGDEVTLNPGANLTANGSSLGGMIRIGGGFQGNDASVLNSDRTTVKAGASLSANASNGAGGTIILWSDGDTTFRGSLSATGIGTKGGFAEVSGKKNLEFTGDVLLGRGGHLLLDPTDFTIDSSNAPGITSTLNGGTDVTIVTDSVNGMDEGDITVDAPIMAIGSSDVGTLSLLAYRHIKVNQPIQLRGNMGGLNLVAGWNGTTGFVYPPAPGITNEEIFITDIMESDMSYGQNGGGSIYIGDGTQTSDIHVGAQHGMTGIFGRDVIITAANNAEAGIGFTNTAPFNAITSSIVVLSNDEVRLDGGTGSSGGRAFIGHAPGPDAIVSSNAFIDVSAKGINLHGGPVEGDAMIGHDGENVGGNIYLNIGGESGSVTLNAHGGRAWVGHRGDVVNGGDIDIYTRALVLNGVDNQVRVGHRGNDSAEGHINIFADYQVDLLGNNWNIGHTGTTLGSSSLHLATNGLGHNTSTYEEDFVLEGDTLTKLTSILGYGDLTLAFIGDDESAGLIIEDPLAYTSHFSLNLLSSGSVTLDGPVANGGTGDFNIVGGWDTNTDLVDLLWDTQSFGRGEVTYVSLGLITLQGGDLAVYGNQIGANATVNPGLGGTANFYLSDHQDGSITFAAQPWRTTVTAFGENASLYGPDQNTSWVINAANSGTFAPAVGTPAEIANFNGFANLNGGIFNDSFIYLNQATLSGEANGGGGLGQDTLFIDDSNLSAKSTYTITDGRIERNPVYLFTGMESIGIHGGTSADQFLTQLLPYAQFYNGGGGNNNLLVQVPPYLSQPVIGSPIVVPGYGTITFLNMPGGANFNPPYTGQPGPGLVPPIGGPGNPLPPGPGIGNGGNNPPPGPPQPTGPPVNLISDNSSQLQQKTDTQEGARQEAQNQANNNQGNNNNGNMGGNGGVTPPGQETEVTQDTGPTETSDSGVRVAPNVPQAVMNRFNDLFGDQSRQDFNDAGLNVN